MKVEVDQSELNEAIAKKPNGLRRCWTTLKIGLLRLMRIPGRHRWKACGAREEYGGVQRLTHGKGIPRAAD